MGESQLGSLDGVVSTRAAWVGSHEVVELRYRPTTLSFEKLLEHAIENSCDQRVFATSAAQLEVAKKHVGARAERLEQQVRVATDSDQLYYLKKSYWNYVPLTPLQSSKVNAALSRRGSSKPEEHCSPRQRALAISIQSALAKDARALDGLSRPDEISELDEYESRLRQRLR